MQQGWMVVKFRVGLLPICWCEYDLDMRNCEEFYKTQKLKMKKLVHDGLRLIGNVIVVVIKQMENRMNENKIKII